ncbi:unnamed protein product [Alternaria alternata]
MFCVFCRFIAVLDGSRFDDIPQREIQIYVIFHAKGSMNLGHGTSIHAVWPTRAQLRISPYVGWSWCRSWLDDLIERANGDYTSFTAQKELQDVPVIDVQQDCVIRLSSTSEYVALLYVWGTNSESQLQLSAGNVDELQQPLALEHRHLPRTIADAMGVCKRLEQRFLWVDRLCIIQDQASDAMSTQLNQMVAIYSRATFTIVAAAGESATHGLVGVSRARAASQRTLRLDDQFAFVTEVPNLQTTLSLCTWQQCGWTYQEYVASRIILFFTEFGLYFQAENGSTAAYPTAPIDDAEGTNESRSRYGAEKTGIRKDGVEIDGFRMIETFSERRLIHADDVLRASSGTCSAI